MMATPTKRTTVYLDPDLHKALRLKAIAVSRSLSDLVNEAVRELLKKDRHRYKLIKELASTPGIQMPKDKK
ncbi:MAG: CopG family transcriptional regulator [Dehalococcoidia bacterium]|jgi:plasmid stability protein